MPIKIKTNFCLCLERNHWKGAFFKEKGKVLSSPDHCSLAALPGPGLNLKVK